MTKKLTAMLLVCLLMLGMVLPASAAETGALSGSALAADGAITVTLALKSGSGVRSGSFQISYDRSLKLKSSEKGLLLEDVNTSRSGTVSCSWVGTPAEGKALLSLTFTNASARDYSFQVSQIKVFDKEYKATALEDFDIEIYVSCSGGNCPSKSYSDVDQNAWYHNAVDYVLGNGLMEGYDSKTFDPDGSMTRAMLVTILGRMEGIDPGKYGASGFKDVKSGVWYAPYVAWASQEKLVEGYEDGTFRPDQQITREEMVTILYRYWTANGNQWKQDVTALKGFQDAKKVSTWALTAMRWAVSMQVINGTGNDMLEPQGVASRAQIAKIIMVYARELR